MLTKRIENITLFNGTGVQLVPGVKLYFGFFPNVMNNIVRYIRVIIQDQGNLGVQDNNQLQLAAARRLLVTLFDDRGIKIANRIPAMSLASDGGKFYPINSKIDTSKSYVELSGPTPVTINQVSLECTI